MSNMPRTVSASDVPSLGSTAWIGAFFRGLIDAWFKPVAEKAHLSSRSLAFEVHPIGARLAVPSALYVFAYRYARGWRVLYVGAQARHKIQTAIGYGATHLLVRAGSVVDEAWLIDELNPPLNDVGFGGWR
jgi:hypothetical protein